MTRPANCQTIDTPASPLEQPWPLRNAEATTPTDAESNTPPDAEASTPSLSQPQPSPSFPGKPEVPSCPEVTPAEELGTVVIHQTTTMLLIGDSVIRNIDLSKSLPTQQTTPQKVCVPGLSAEDLIKWVQSAEPTPAVQQATFLVGINSCIESSTEAVSESTWSDPIAACRRTFPHASLRASSILPARGRCSLNDIISPSNSNLAAACHRLKVLLNRQHSYVHHRKWYWSPSHTPFIPSLLHHTLTTG